MLGSEINPSHNWDDNPCGVERIAPNTLAWNRVGLIYCGI